MKKTKGIKGRKLGKGYPQVYNGESIAMKNGDILRFACCDCGLVHNMAFISDKKGNIGFAVERNNRSTSRLRKYRTYKYIPCSPDTGKKEG